MTGVVALTCAVAIVSYNRGRQDERDSRNVGNWVIEDMDISPTAVNTSSGTESGDWIIED